MAVWADNRWMWVRSLLELPCFPKFREICAARCAHLLFPALPTLTNLVSIHMCALPAILLLPIAF